MARANPTAPDAAHVVSGTITGTGPVPPQLYFSVSRAAFNYSIWGLFIGTVTLERSFDGGITFLNVSIDTAGTPNAVSNGISTTCQEIEEGVIYRINCTSFTSGMINWRISA